MKKFMFVAVVFFTLFSLIGCGGGQQDGPGNSTEWVIKHDKNGWTGQWRDNYNEENRVDKGSRLGAALVRELTGSETLQFIGWAITPAIASNSELVTLNYIPQSDITLYVIWRTVIPPGQPVTITYHANGWDGTGVPSATSSGVSGEAIGADNLPILEDTETQEFKGWALTPEGRVINAARVIDSNTDLYVIWVPVIETVYEEILALQNGAHAIYEFVLPEGRKLGDYVAISYQVKLHYFELIPEDVVDNKPVPPETIRIRTARLYGPYPKDRFSDREFGDPSKNHLGAVVAQFDDNNGKWIAGERTQWTGDYSEVGWELGSRGWFTVEFVLTGEDGYTGANSSKGAGNWPASTATGPFYFGIGINGDEGPIVQTVRNIRLVGYEGVPDLYAEGSGFEYPAFAAYVAAGSMAFNYPNVTPNVGGGYRGDVIPIYVRFENNHNDTGGDGRSFSWQLPGNSVVFPAPKRDGYKIDKWTREPAGGTAVPASTTFTTSDILYAQWVVDEDFKPATPKGDLRKVVLGQPTWFNDYSSPRTVANTWGWATKGTTVTGNGVIAADNLLLDLADVKGAVWLELITDKIPVSAGTVVWGNNTTSSIQTGNHEGIFIDKTGVPHSAVGVTIEGTEAPYTITFEMSKAFTEYEKWDAVTGWLRFGIVCNWFEEASSPDFAPDVALGIREANLYVPKE